MPVVLVVDDEPAIRESLAFALRRDGFGIEEAAALREAEQRAEGADLIILDLVLPDGSGLDFLRTLRARSDVPVIVLTSRDEETDRVVGLEMGADDYVLKPFSPREVVARVRAVLRRSRPSAAGTSPVTIGPLQIDAAAHTVSVDGVAVNLTRREFDLLRALVEARGRVLSREFLLDNVWGYTAAGEIESRTVDVHVRRLRQKLGPAGRRIGTVTGVGYRLERDD